MFGDGAEVDLLAVVADGRLPGQDPYARPPTVLDGFAATAAPVATAAPAVPVAPAVPSAPVEVIQVVEPPAEDAAHHPREPPAPSRARPAWPRGTEGRRTVAEEYRAAQREGRDPVLAVMSATGRSRRKSLKLIAASRDAGFLSPRHNRR
ncbi:hypothetical protein KY5_0952c [Streptomyces formicae]|uniref:Uncharacterized protein n=2 Tax=Streptomyces formicae TaxID=1616117 RepID=A0A291Q2I2_9ACTN|nr:hypothetical protein KY5_0952c [Streptomyces formicae]